MLLPIQTAGALRSRETSVIRPKNQGIQAQAGKTCNLIASGTYCEPLTLNVGNLVCSDLYQCTTINDDGSWDITHETVETSCGECTPDLGPTLPAMEVISAPAVLRRSIATSPF